MATGERDQYPYVPIHETYIFVSEPMVRIEMSRDM